VLLAPLIAELLWKVVAGVQNDHDAIIRCLEDLILLEGRVKVYHLQLFEFAEGPWEIVVVEVQDEASILRERVDDLGLEDSSPAASEDTNRSW